MEKYKEKERRRKAGKEKNTQLKKKERNLKNDDKKGLGKRKNGGKAKT